MKYAPYSSSRLDSATCGYLFYHTYVEPRVDRKKIRSLPQDRGSAVHEILEYMAKAYKKDINHPFFTVPAETRYAKPKPTEEMQKAIQDAVNLYPASYQQIDVLESCAATFARRRLDIIDEETGVELMLAVKREGDTFVQCDFDDKKAIMRGKIDLLFFSDDAKGATIVDHKTQMNIEQADTFQMGVYAWLTSKCHPWLEEIESSLYFAQFGVHSEPVVWDKEDLARMEGEILSRIDIVESRTNWDPCPNHNCQYCDLVAECPALTNLVEVDKEKGFVMIKDDNVAILGDTNKAVYIAQMIKVLETYVNAARKTLRDHVKEFGPISIPGTLYEHRPKTEVDWKKANKIRWDLKKLLVDNGIDPVEYMGFSATFSKDLALIDNDKLRKEIFDKIPTKTSTTFKGYKM